MKHVLLLPLVWLGQIVYGQELPGLILHAKMESSCELTDEIAGSPANGAIIDISLTADRLNTPNSAFSFDQNSSYITLGAANKLKLTGDQSISFWIKPFITGANRIGSIFTYGTGMVIGYQEQTSVPKLNISFGNTLYLQQNLTTQWQEVTITFTKDYSSAKSKVSLYINGIATSESEQNKSTMDFTNAIAIIGPASQSSPTNGYRGSLDEIKIYNRALTATEILNAALPVKLEFFNGKRINGTVHLIWKTLVEENVLYFNVQKSADGVVFETINKIFAGKYNYEVFDNTRGDNDAWYRLQIVDKDGKTEYSDVIKVERDTTLTSEVVIFPNPATNIINFRGVDVHHTVKIISITGALVKQQSLINNKIDIADIRPGLYYIVVYDNNGNKKTISKFIKRNDR